MATRVDIRLVHPASANNLTTLSHDLPYDPNWLIIEQDFYALLQTSGFVDLSMYSYGIYYYRQ